MKLLDDITMALKIARAHFDNTPCYWFGHGFLREVLFRRYDADRYVDHLASVLRRGELLDGHRIKAPQHVLKDSQILWSRK